VYISACAGGITVVIMRVAGRESLDGTCERKQIGILDSCGGVCLNSYRFVISHPGGDSANER